MYLSFPLFPINRIVREVYVLYLKGNEIEEDCIVSCYFRKDKAFTRSIGRQAIWGSPPKKRKLNGEKKIRIIMKSSTKQTKCTILQACDLLGEQTPLLGSQLGHSCSMVQA